MRAATAASTGAESESGERDCSKSVAAWHRLADPCRLASPGDGNEYPYLLAHYEADPDNDKDPEHILKAFDQCLASKPVAEHWQGSDANATKAPGGGEREQIASEAMKQGSKLQALVDQRMARKGYHPLAS